MLKGDPKEAETTSSGVGYGTRTDAGAKGNLDCRSFRLAVFFFVSESATINVVFKL